MTASEYSARFDYDPDNDLLGEGGFGKIFRAWDNVRNEFIALKMSGIQPGMEEFSLLSEYERVKHLEHPNIARYMDCQRIKLPGLGTHDIALMKHYEYGNLSQLLNKHTLTTSQKHKLIEGLLDGIAYLHKLKPLIIHSDLKPSNILVVERRGFFIPLITDFGISRQAKAEDKSYVTNLTGAGTYAYAAPEQWEALELRPNADLWSFAILLIYIWFNGKKLPFRSDDISIATESGRIEYMKRVIALDFIPDLKDLPENYRRIVDKCIVVNPQSRARSTDEIYSWIRPSKANDVTNEETVLIAPEKKKSPSFNPMEEKTQVLEAEPIKPAPAPVIKEKLPEEPLTVQKPNLRKRVIIAGSAFLVATITASAIYFTRDTYPKTAGPGKDTVARKPEILPLKKESVKPVAILEKPATEKPKLKAIPTTAKKSLDANAVYHVVEQPPSFPGGQEAMNQWIAANLRMPETAERSFISGIVRLSFVVSSDGAIYNIQILKGLGLGCDEEAVRLVKAMPHWTPGRTAGQKVRVRQTLGIPFE